MSTQIEADAEALNVVKASLDAFVYARTRGVVQSGPFEGMKLLDTLAWKESRLSPLVLGCYEEELHGELERQIARLAKLSAPLVVVIGSAEGYYAVGLKRRLSKAVVQALDPDENANAICRRNAELNDVELVINPAPEESTKTPDLLFLDCEGHELTYLDPEKYSWVRGVHVVVEVHDFEHQNTGAILLERFRGSHRITAVFEGPRNPNRFPLLTGLSSDCRWLAVSENRPITMYWYIMEPRGVSLS